MRSSWSRELNDMIGLQATSGQRHRHEVLADRVYRERAFFRTLIPPAQGQGGTKDIKTFIAEKNPTKDG
jgi:hypothetical protein